MRSALKNGIFIALLGVILSACGGSENSLPPRQPYLGGDDFKSYFLKAFEPTTYALNPASPENPNTLVVGNRPLALFQYDAIVEPNYNEERTGVESMITGIGISAVDTAGNALGFSLGIEAREYNAETGYFSSGTRVFAAQGESFSRAQSFAILNTNSPNYFFSGLGFRMKYGKITSLQIQRKSLLELGYNGASISGSKKVILPNGWVAVGIIIKFHPNIPAGVDSSTVKIPFIQDAILYIGELQNF